MNPIQRISCAITIFLVLVLNSHDAFSDSVQFKPTKLNYSSKLIDTCSPKKIQAINVGQFDIENPEFYLQGSDAFRIQKHFRKCPDPLGPGDKCRVYINFCASLEKTYEAILTFSGSEQVIQLKGSGVSQNSY